VAISRIQISFASITAQAALANAQATTIPQPMIFPRRSVVSEAANHPTFAPYTAAGSNSANTIHPAGAAKTTAASRCHGASVSILVAQKGFTGAARL
jgi:hypothetical protein